jgi:hypothetical protein
MTAINVQAASLYMRPCTCLAALGCAVMLCAAVLLQAVAVVVAHLAWWLARHSAAL